MGVQKSDVLHSFMPYTRPPLMVDKWCVLYLHRVHQPPPPNSCMLHDSK